MATESSAVVRFINTVQQSQAPSLPTLAPDVTMRTRHPRRGLKLSVAVIAGSLVVAGAIALGFTVAKQAKAEAEPVPSLAAVPAPGSAPNPTPAAALAPVEAQAAASAKDTGFDIRVEPVGALVSLDGKEIGRAPLRVRNLLPGEHQIGVAGPDGYFGQHMVVVLAPGSAQELSIELEPLDDEELIASASEDGADEAAAAEAAEQEAVADAADDTAGDARAERRAERRAKRRARRAARRDRARSARVATVSGPTGRLMLGSKPPCDIYVDGRATGKTTPQRDLELSAGSHTITLVNRQHDIKKRFKVRISAGKTTRAIQDLTGRL